MNTIASSSPAKAATITDPRERLRLQRLPCFSSLHLNGLSAKMKINFFPWSRLKVSTSSLSAQSVLMFKSRREISQNDPHVVSGENIWSVFNHRCALVYSKGAWRYFWQYFWQDKGPRTCTQVLPPVWELGLIALVEEAQVTCLPCRFNLTSHILEM